MAWQNQWTATVDGTSINDRTNFVLSSIPELDNLAAMDVIMAELAGDYPVYIRSQPRAMPLTFNISMAQGTSAAQWQIRLATLKTLFSHGQRHQLTVQMRGMANPKSMYFVPESMAMDFTQRLVSVRAIAPKPVLE